MWSIGRCLTVSIVATTSLTGWPMRRPKPGRSATPWSGHCGERLSRTLRCRVSWRLQPSRTCSSEAP
eukprot:300113-Alexandrium_andersonii.AAC.1